MQMHQQARSGDHSYCVYDAQTWPCQGILAIAEQVSRNTAAVMKQQKVDAIEQAMELAESFEPGPVYHWLRATGWDLVRTSPDA